MILLFLANLFYFGGVFGLFWGYLRIFGGVWDGCPRYPQLYTHVCARRAPASPSAPLCSRRAPTLTSASPTTLGPAPPPPPPPPRLSGARAAARACPPARPPLRTASRAASCECLLRLTLCLLSEERDEHRLKKWPEREVGIWNKSSAAEGVENPNPQRLVVY